MIDYSQFPGLAGVYLEDSYVLDISEAPGQLTFNLDAVLTPESPAYQAPRAGEHYCYAVGRLIFTDVKQLDWGRTNENHFRDASGEEDLGNIDILRWDGDSIVAEGDWGEVRVKSAPPRFVLGE